METVPSTSSWMPEIGNLAGNRSCPEVTSFLSRMFSGNMVAWAHEADDNGMGVGWGWQSYVVTPTVRTVGSFPRKSHSPLCLEH